MSAFAERVLQDLRKIQELSEATGNRVHVVSKSGNPANKITIELDYPTAPSSSYPSEVQNKTKVSIELLSRYPFQEPNAVIKTPVYHPNVYDSGKICFGTKWLPTQGLDLLVRRIIQIITFDPMILNAASPANRSALSWYEKAVRKHPHAFPTDKLQVREKPKKKIGWSNISETENEKTVVSCPQCDAKLRVPQHKKGNIACPKCHKKFYVET